MNKAPLASILMTRTSWTGIAAALLSYVLHLLEEREELAVTGETDEVLEIALRDWLQKTIPVILHAADTEEYPELTPVFKTLLQRAGLVVPENFEDLGKQLVTFE